MKEKKLYENKMAIAKLHQFLTTKSKSTLIFWFSLSLTFAAIYGSMALRQAFGAEYLVQDDARQHIFWMQRFFDADFFPNDLIADYFQSVAPAGYTALYKLMAGVGIQPLLFSKILPFVLGLIATGYCFAVCLQLLPVPAAGFIAALLLNHNFWMQDDLLSSTPRAFVYPLFLAFLYYFLKRSLVPCLVAIAILGIFYPPFLVIESGILILSLLQWDGKRIRLSENRGDRLLIGAGLAVALIVMLPYALNSSEYGPIISGSEARTLPEFSRRGRIPFFYDDPLKFWFYGGDSGIMRKAFEPPLSWAWLLWPILLRYSSFFPLVKQITSKVTVLPQIALTSLGMFFAAHALLYNLFAPSRYTRYSLRLVMIFASAMALIVILDAILRSSLKEPNPPAPFPKREGGEISPSPKRGGISPSPFRGGGRGRGQFLALGLTVTIVSAVVFYPSFLKTFPKPNYTLGKVPALYEFFTQQPKDITIASLSEEVDNIPPFSKRSILVGWEYANPYHVGYYRQIRDRAIDLIRAQYSSNLTEVQNFIQKYRVDFLMLDRAFFTPEYIKDNPWFKQWKPIAKEILSTLNRKTPPVLASLSERCKVFEIENLVVLQADCIAKSPQIQ